MSDVFSPFRVATLRRTLRICLFVGKWLLRLLPQTVEPFLRSNFGRRYVLQPFGAWFLFLICASLNPRPAATSSLFLVSLFALITYHCVRVFQRNRLSAAEPHSSSTGDSWKIWQNHGFSKSTVQCYLEPALCGMVGLLVLLPDPFLGWWLMLSAVALFIKEQYTLFKLNRRVMDALDAKLAAQALNNSLRQPQSGPGPRAQKSHRAHFPNSGHRPHP